nr:hypothetical protein [Tanacetum cinerariifolium]
MRFRTYTKPNRKIAYSNNIVARIRYNEPSGKSVSRDEVTNKSTKTAHFQDEKTNQKGKRGCLFVALRTNLEERDWSVVSAAKVDEEDNTHNCSQISDRTMLLKMLLLFWTRSPCPLM